jgi:hypothetical protein
MGEATPFAEDPMLHTMLVVLHAAAALVCLRPACCPSRTARQPPGASAYFWSLPGMLLFLAAAIAAHWGDLDTTTRLIFLGLGALGLYLAWRAAQAGTRLRRQGHNWRPRYIDDIGFTLIALFDGFVIVAAIDLGAPAWLVVLVAIAGIGGGIHAMKPVKARLVGP